MPKNSNEVSFYTYGTKAVQVGKQIEQESIYDDDNEIPSSLLPNTTAAGYLVFPKMETGEMKIVFDAPSDSDYMQNWEDIEFTLNIE